MKNITNLDNELLVCTPTGVSEYVVPTAKTCGRCGLMKSTSSFNREQKKADGLSAWCKACKSADQIRRRQEKLLGDPDWELRRRTFARLARAVQAGEIVKPTRCPLCAKETTSREMQAAFLDPRDPTTVRWRCRACALALAGKRQLAVCRWCKEPFVAQTTTIRRGGGRYCTVRCRNAWMKSTAEHIRGTAPGERTSAEAIFLDDRF